MLEWYVDALEENGHGRAMGFSGCELHLLGERG